MKKNKPHPMNKLGRKLVQVAAISSLLVFSNAYATGLGKLTVLSSLGQPFRGEIELTAVNREEIASLVPKLASPEAFKQQNIEFNPALMNLRFLVEQRGKNYVIKISSSQPMNEPWVDFLLEMNSSSGRLVREYTVLLDPADLTSSSGQVSQGNTVQPKNIRDVSNDNVTARPLSDTSKSTKKAKRSAKVDAESAETTASVPSAASNMVSNGDGYKVKSGDTLSKIAARNANGASLEQMLVSIYQANPDAFVGSNMNRLKAGQILTIPDSESAKSLPPSEAHQIILAQSSDFNAYRNKLANQVAILPTDSASSKQSATKGKISAKVKDQSASISDSPDKLKLSKVKTDKANTKKSEEDLIAKDKQLASANARVKELERNVNDLNKILAIKGKSVEDSTSKSVSVVPKSASSIASTPSASAKVGSSVSVSTPVSSASATVSTKSISASSTSPVLPDVSVASAPSNSKPSASASSASAASASVIASATAANASVTSIVDPIVDSSSSASVPATANEAPKNISSSDVSPVGNTSETSPPKAKPKKITTPPPPPKEESINWMDPMYLAGGGGLLAALAGGILFFTNRRKKKAHQFEDSILTGSSLKANSLFGSTGGQSVDTNNSVFNSNFAPSASQLDANEVDPVAEADVYIAYGRDSQAEEILREALRTQPDRHSVRLKLLEIYYNRKDNKTFDLFAGELYGMTGGKGDDWEHAASMGAALDPNNPLYAGAEQKISNSAPIDSTQPLEDLDVDVVADSALPKDMLESISIIDTAHALDHQQGTHQPLETDSEQEINDFGDLDFNLDIKVADDSNSAHPQTMPLEEDSGLKSADESVPALDFGSIDFDLDSEKSKIEVEPLQVDSPQLDAADDLGLAFSLDAQNQTQSIDKSEVHNSALNFNVQALDSDSSDHAFNAEMATKLDLAVAYQEIGDKEGARELLEEVVRGGSADQIEVAKTMLEKL